MYECMSIMASIALLPIPEGGIPYYAILLKISSLLIKGVFSRRLGDLESGGVINICPIKPFATVMTIKGYTNPI